MKTSHFVADQFTDKLCKQFNTNESSGLTSCEAALRLSRFGKNEIVDKDDFVYLRIFLRQFQSSVVILLLLAQAVSFMAGEILQAIAILFALLVNALIGFATELKAKVSIQSLEDLMKPNTRVIRDGQEEVLDAKFLVPGDIVLLEAGNCVPADLKLIEAVDLRLDESALTGESITVFKSIDSMQETQDEVFQGTVVQTGRARGIVFATGMDTKIGKLGKLLLEAGQNQTPLEHNLDVMGANLSKLIIVSCIFLFFVGVLHDEKPWTMIHVCIALAVAAIPEGMPVIATLALAAGTRKMARYGALVKKLPAVETLGCTAIICSDKTGTLTENQMLVSDIVTYLQHIKLEGKGYEPSGNLFDTKLLSNDQEFLSSSPFRILIEAAALCNDATLENHAGKVSWHIHGDPTEGALLTAAVKSGVELTSINTKYTRFFEIPFSLERKMMSTAHKTSSNSIYLFSKGSPSSILKQCNSYEFNSSQDAFTQDIKEWFIKQNEELAINGLRVLAFAYKKYESEDAFLQDEDKEKELTFLGLAAMSDQIRENVAEAIDQCKQAGIRVIMVTGDQAPTAKAIASKLKLDNSEVLTAKEMEQMSEQELKNALKHSSVLARTTPELKLKIVRSLQESGLVVAMTGDGVNDAPALRQADVGIAMGKNGTDLAREACHLLLTDDNFSTIVKAIKEGRIIYTNIRKSVAYLLTASFSSVFVVAFNVIFHSNFYLNPIQLLWLNLIMHIFPGLALALERTKTNIMIEPPRPKDEPLLSKKTYEHIFYRSIFTASIITFITHQVQNILPDKNLTIGFTTLSLLLLAQAWSWIYFSNEGLNWPKEFPRLSTVLCMAISYTFLLVALYMPGLNTILCLKPLELNLFVCCLITAWLCATFFDLTIFSIQYIRNKKC